MKAHMRILLLAGLAGLVFGLSGGCNEDPPTGLYDLPRETRPQPVVTSVDPPASALAGVTSITITGSNFSTVKEENFVYFDASLAQIISASATQLVVRAPVLVKDSVTLRVMVYKAELFSTPRPYKLMATVEKFGGLAVVDEPFGITSDAAGNIYVSIVSGGSGVGVKKITPGGVKTDYAPVTPGVTRWSGMKIGPGGVLYTARILRVIYQVPAGGVGAIWVTGSTIGSIYDLDFDAGGNCWAAGNNASVYRVKQDKSIKPFAFTGNVRAVRIYSGYLYLGGKVDTTEGVWRAQIINSDSLGTFEKYFDFTAKYPTSVVNALTFAADGDMYIGTDAADAIVVVHASKVSEPLYPGLFTATSYAFTWGISDDLYIARTVNTPALLKVRMLKDGAPYYGRQL
jgi:hypothetical protein